MLTGLAAGAALVLGGLGFLVWSEYGAIEAARLDVETARTQIGVGRKLVAGTAALERDVIVLRETEQAIKEILPDDKDLNELIRDLQAFERSSEVQITSIKKKDPSQGRRKEAEAFEKAIYELVLEGDAFEVLAFLDLVEGHRRFLRIPTIHWSASGEQVLERDGRALHTVKLEIETFVYKPQNGPELVKIDGYARKRELLLGEIARHRDAVAVEHFDYRGQRGRRDPWVDPRVPVTAEGPGGLPVAEQIERVDALVERAVSTSALWTALERPGTLYVEQVRLRVELETALTTLEDDLRKLAAEGAISYPIAEARLRREVSEPMAALRASFSATAAPSGPPAETLRTLLASMHSSIEEGKPKLALETLSGVESELALVRDDPLRQGLIVSMRAAAEDARALIDFQSIELRISGIAIQDGAPPVAVINGRALGEGDVVATDLVVGSIRAGEIEFIFRGLVLVRRF
jgi:Tfp pilus assembly protein PilO